MGSQSLRLAVFAIQEIVGGVVYIISGKHCVFSALLWNTQTSINAAEEIIAAICKKEGLRQHDLQFYDLLTHLGYRLFSPGSFVFKKIILQPEIRWEHIECPAGVVEVFRGYIGGARPVQQPENYSGDWESDRACGVIELFPPET